MAPDFREFEWAMPAAHKAKVHAYKNNSLLRRRVRHGPWHACRLHRWGNDQVALELIPPASTGSIGRPWNLAVSAQASCSERKV